MRGCVSPQGSTLHSAGAHWVLVLGGLDHMDVEVQDREQVQVREKVEAREAEEEDKTRKQQTLKHVMCMNIFLRDTRRDTLSHNVV